MKISFVAEDKGVDSLARQIKMTGRAFPLFEIGQMVLKKPERYSVVFSEVRNAEGKVAQPLFVCALDDTIWLSDDAAEKHILDKHLDAFYKAEKIPTDPPKGTYTFVAVCGMSGRILGPPNHHDYQNQLAKLHKERFGNMAFDTFKSRVKIVRDEETVNKWIEQQSFKTEYECLNLPEPKRVGSWDEVVQHFRQTHRETVIRGVESHTIPAVDVRKSPTAVVQRLVRRYLDEQQRFPLKLVHVLSQQFASRGLQFFKVNKSVTHVSVARPHFLDLESSPVSDGIRKIVDYVNANPGCNRKQLIEALAPTPVQEAPAAPAEPAPADAPEGSEPKAEQAPAPTAAPEPTPEQEAVISDLHWLVHQGHVIEFASGKMETAKKPAPKPVQEKKQKAPEAPAAKTASEASPSDAGSAPETKPVDQPEPAPDKTEAKVAEEPVAPVPAEDASPQAENSGNADEAASESSKPEA